MKMKKLSPVLIVEAIEPCLPFWIDRLGFQMLADVKDGDRYAFVLLAKDEVQVMLQTLKSVSGDMPQLTARDREGSTCLYIDVDDLDDVERAMNGVAMVVPRRTTFYGAIEIGVREPAGNLVVFAQHDG